MQLREIKCIYVNSGIEISSKEKAICSAKAAAEYFRFLENSPKEILITAVVDTQNNILSFEKTAIGTADACLFDPKAIIRVAVLTNATGLMMVHNHPSGILSPSHEDINVTQRIISLCDLMSLSFLDHIILGYGGNYFSFRANRLIN